MANDFSLESHSNRQIGGLVLKTKELIGILNEENTSGLGFGLVEQGKADNVYLKVYRVFLREGRLIKEERNVLFRKGAPQVNEPSDLVELFVFEYLDELKQSNFDFTYIEREKFLDIIDEEEVFIYSILLDLGNSKRFGLGISPRADTNSEMIGLGGAPLIFFMLPISPFGKKNDKSDCAVMRTFFATDRNFTNDKNPSKMFGGERSRLTYGFCEVSIPIDHHRMGKLESPSIWRFEFKNDTNKHIVLLKTHLYEKSKFFEEVAANVKESQGKNAFLFVHGYNVTFEDAARRTAQICYDLEFKGMPVFYSWPSRGKTISYTIDEQNIEWTQINLRAFLEDFFNKTNAEKIFLIAHSMGNRALTRALASLLADQPEIKNRLEEVILTAPDIDADVFRREIAPALSASKRPITLYASSEDLALIASKKVHGYPRTGDTGEDLVICDGIETIDATGVDTSFLGHSYFAETRSVLSDIFYIIRNGSRADSRFGLERRESEVGQYWGFKK